MWSNQTKWVWTQAYHIFVFLLDVILHSKSFVLLKSQLKLGISLQSYDLLKGCQSNRKLKDLIPMFGSIAKSIFASSDSFCFITSQIFELNNKSFKAHDLHRLSSAIFPWSALENNEVYILQFISYTFIAMVLLW